MKTETKGWVPYGKTISNMMHDGLFSAGVLLEIKSDGMIKSKPEDGGMKDTGLRKYEFLIGNVNELGGMCDGKCEIDYNKIVLRYKIIWEPKQEEQALRYQR